MPVNASETVHDRAARGRQLYARNLGLPERETDATMSSVAGRAFVHEAYLAAGGPGWHGPHLSDRDRAFVVIAALVAQHVTDDRLDPYLALARNNGVSQQGLETAMILLSSYIGQPAASRGAAAVCGSVIAPGE